MALVIGVSGKKRSGKDTLIAMLRGYAEADGYDTEMTGFGLEVAKETAQLLTDAMRGGDPTYSFLIDTARDCDALLARILADETKEEYRTLMQWVGDYRRRYWGQDYWLQKIGQWIGLHQHQPDKLLFITGVRFPNEVKLIRSFGGLVYRVERPGYILNDDTHGTETGLDGYEGFDVVISATDMEDLRAKAEGLWDDLAQVCRQKFGE